MGLERQAPDTGLSTHAGRPSVSDAADRTYRGAPRIVQFAVPYSPNVGDGVISDCLAHALESLLPDAEFKRIDLSGRQDFGDVTLRNRALVIQLLSRLPKALRQRLVSAKLSRMLDRIEAEWRAAVAHADLAIIGGGQLFSDADLNFCLKVARASDVLADAGVPVVIHAAGVAGNWSRRGTELFTRVINTNLQMIGLRDMQSVDAWSAQCQAAGLDTLAPEITRDPGLLAAECYGAVAATHRVGIGVTAAQILAYHADDSPGAASGPEFFAGLAKALASRGHAVALFCNGAREDRDVLQQLAKRPDLRQQGVEFLAAPDTPAELARMIGGLSGLVAHRLHACILGYSYRIPVVGLGWDQKVESFFGSTGRSDFFLAARDVEVASASALLERSLAAGIDPATHRAVLSETKAGLGRALNAGLQAAVSAA